MIEQRGQDDQLGGLETALGYRFRDRALLLKALTHRSHSHERGRGAEDSYERLEFLGDALLGLFVADWLFRRDETAPEGSLSRRRQMVVRTSTLAAIAGRIGLGDAIRLGRGEELTGGRGKVSLLADLFEAVLGAVYLDGGVRPARAFVRRHLGRTLLETGTGERRSDDYKTRLQEEIQARLQRTPGYRIVSTTGPAHALRFEVEVLVDGRALGRGTGSNRKRAEQDAARQALTALEAPDE
jgi:ribonuclease-3